MNPNFDLNQEVDTWLSRISAAQSDVTDDAIRAQLQAVAQQMEAGRQQFNAEYQKKLDEIQQRLSGAKQKAAETIQKASETRAAAAEAAKKPAFNPFAPPPKPPPVHVDPAFGLKLREELLHRFGKRRKAGLEGLDRDIWEDLEE